MSAPPAPVSAVPPVLSGLDKYYGMLASSLRTEVASLRKRTDIETYLSNMRQRRNIFAETDPDSVVSFYDQVVRVMAQYEVAWGREFLAPGMSPPSSPASSGSSSAAPPQPQFVVADETQLSVKRENEAFARSVANAARERAHSFPHEDACAYIFSPLLTKDARAIVLIGWPSGDKSAERWRTIVDYVEREQPLPSLLSSGANKSQSLSRRLAAIFYASRHGLEVRQHLEQLQEETAGYDLPRPAEDSEKMLQAWEQELVDSMAAAPKSTAEDVTLEELIALSNQVEVQSLTSDPTVAELIGVHTEKTERAMWQGFVDPLDPLHTSLMHNTLGLLRQTTGFDGNYGIAPLYLSAVTGRLGQMIKAPDAGARSRLHDDAVVREIPPKKVAQGDTELASKVFAEAPFWLLLLAETVFSAVLEDLHDQSVDSLALLERELGTIVAKIRSGPSSVVLPPEFRKVGFHKLAREVAGRVTTRPSSAAVQVAEFGTVFVPELEAGGFVRVWSETLGDDLRGQLGNYETLLEGLLGIKSRAYLISTNELEFEAQAAKFALEMEGLNAPSESLAGTFGLEMAHFLPQTGAPAPPWNATACALFERYGDPRAAQVACARLLHFSGGQVEGLPQASGELAATFGGRDHWMADALSTSRAYLCSKLCRGCTGPSAEECARNGRMALAEMDRERLQRHIFGWVDWLVLLTSREPGETRLFADVQKEYDGGKVKAAALLANKGPVSTWFGRKLGGAADIARTIHPSEVQVWQRAWQSIGSVPLVGMFSLVLDECTKSSVATNDATSMGTVIAQVETMLILLAKLHKQAENFFDQEERDVIDVTSVKVDSSNTLAHPNDYGREFVERITNSSDQDDQYAIFKVMYEASVWANPSVVRPSAVLLRAMRALCLAEVSEAVDAAFSQLARGLWGWLAAQAQDEVDVRTICSSLVALLAAQPRFVSALAANPAWTLQLSQHLCSLPGTVSLVLGELWPKLFLKGVAGNKAPEAHLMTSHYLVRSIQVLGRATNDHQIRADQRSAVYGTGGLPMVARLHESAQAVVPAGVSQRQYVAEDPHWRRALIFFCNRCAEYSTACLTSMPNSDPSARAQFAYHLNVVSICSGGSASRLSDAQLMDFAVYCLVGNASPVDSQPLDASRQEVIEAAYDLYESRALVDPAVKAICTAAADSAAWLDMSGAIKVVSETGRRLDGFVAQARELIKGCKRLQLGFDNYFTEHNKVVTRRSVIINQLAMQDRLTRAQATSSERGALMTEYLRDTEKAIVPHFAQAQRFLASYAQSEKELSSRDKENYHKIFPYIHDVIYSADAIKSIARQYALVLERAFLGLQQVRAAVVAWYGEWVDMILATHEELMVQLTPMVEAPIAQYKAMFAEAEAVMLSALAGSRLQTLKYVLQATSALRRQYASNAQNWDKADRQTKIFAQLVDEAANIMQSQTVIDAATAHANLVEAYDYNEAEGRSTLIGLQDHRDLVQPVRADLDVLVEEVRKSVPAGSSSRALSFVDGLTKNLVDVDRCVDELVQSLPPAEADVLKIGAAAMEKNFNRISELYVDSVDKSKRAAFDGAINVSLSSRLQTEVTQIADEIRQHATDIQQKELNELPQLLAQHIPGAQMLLLSLNQALGEACKGLFGSQSAERQALRQAIARAQAALGKFNRGQERADFLAEVEALNANGVGPETRAIAFLRKNLMQHEQLVHTGTPAVDADIDTAKAMISDPSGTVADALTKASQATESWERVMGEAGKQFDVIADDMDKVVQLVQEAENFEAFADADLQHLKAMESLVVRSSHVHTTVYGDAQLTLPANVIIKDQKMRGFDSQSTDLPGLENLLNSLRVDIDADIASMDATIVNVERDVAVAQSERAAIFAERQMLVDEYKEANPDGVYAIKLHGGPVRLQLERFSDDIDSFFQQLHTDIGGANLALQKFKDVRESLAIRLPQLIHEVSERIKDLSANPAPAPVPQPQGGDDGGSGSGSGSGSILVRPKLFGPEDFFDPTPLKAQEVAPDKIFNFFNDKIVGNALFPVKFFKREYIQMIADQPPFDAMQLTNSDGKQVLASDLIMEVYDKGRATTYYALFMYTAVLKYVAQVTSLAVHSYEEWVEGLDLTKKEVNFWELSVLVAEVAEAEAADLQQMYDDFVAAVNAPSSKQMISGRKGKDGSVPKRSFTPNLMSDYLNIYLPAGYDALHMRASKPPIGGKDFSDVKFFAKHPPGRKDKPSYGTPDRMLNNEKHKKSERALSPVLKSGAGSSAEPGMMAIAHADRDYGYDSDPEDTPEAAFGISPGLARIPRL